MLAGIGLTSLPTLWLANANLSSLLEDRATVKLPQHRGLFASEDLGTLEKFRPYGIPTAEWLDNVQNRVGYRRAKNSDGST